MDNLEQVEEVDQVEELQDLQGADFEENYEDLEEKIIEPEVKMSFNSPDEMFEYYKAYGLQEGFPVMRRLHTSQTSMICHFLLLWKLIIMINQFC